MISQTLFSNADLGSMGGTVEWAPVVPVLLDIGVLELCIRSTDIATGNINGVVHSLEYWDLIFSLTVQF